MNQRVIKPLIKFNSSAIYIGVGFAEEGRNALGKFKYDLTKLVGKLRVWTETVLIYTFFGGCVSNLQVGSC